MEHTWLVRTGICEKAAEEGKRYYGGLYHGGSDNPSGSGGNEQIPRAGRKENFITVYP